MRIEHAFLFNLGRLHTYNQAASLQVPCSLARVQLLQRPVCCCTQLQSWASTSSTAQKCIQCLTVQVHRAYLRLYWGNGSKPSAGTDINPALRYPCECFHSALSALSHLGVSSIRECHLHAGYTLHMNRPKLPTSAQPLRHAGRTL